MILLTIPIAGLLFMEDIDSLNLPETGKEPIEDMEEQEVSDELKSPESVVNLIKYGSN